MNKTTKTLGKVALLLIVLGAICAASSMLIIEFVTEKAYTDYFFGWLAVLFILLSILMFIAFLTSMIYNQIRAKQK